MDQRRPQLNSNYARNFIVTAHLLICSIVALPMLGAEGEVLVDAVVASVDGQPILHSEVMKKVEKGPLVVISEFPAKAEDPAFDKALYDAINLQIVFNRSKELDIQITDDELDKQIQSYYEQKGVTIEQLKAEVVKEGLTYESLRSDFRNQLVLRRFQGKVILRQVKDSITEKDVETFYLSSSGSIANVVELTLRQIFIEIPSNAPADLKAQKQKLLTEIEQRVGAGMKFEDAVKIYTDDLDARSSGGLMEGIKVKDLSPAIKSAVENLKVGEMSRPVEVENGYRIFQVSDRKIAGNQEFQEKKAQLQRQLEMIEIGNQTNKWLAQQRQKTNIKILKN